MSILNDSIAIFLGLAWNCLSSSDSDIRDESAFKILLEELEIDLSAGNVMAGDGRNPN